MISFTRVLILIAALVLISTSCASDKISVTKAAIGNPVSDKITVMNPALANPMVDRVALTKRLDSLENKTLYLVDINWGGPDAAYGVFAEMKTWFSENMPDVNVVLKRKNGSYMSDDPALWKEIGEKGDAAVIGISG